MGHITENPNEVNFQNYEKMVPSFSGFLNEFYNIEDFVYKLIYVQTQKSLILRTERALTKKSLKNCKFHVNIFAPKVNFKSSN